MLKIHSFLHEVKDNKASLGIMILKKRDKIAAPIIYVLVATLLVLNFNYFNGFGKKTNELHAKAETIINLLGEVEETKKSEILTTDMQQYTFSSLNLIKDKSKIEKIEKLQELTSQTITNKAIQVFPLGQFSIINTNDEATDMSSLKMSATIADQQINTNQLTKESEEEIETLSLTEDKSQIENKEVSSQEQGKAQSEKTETSSQEQAKAQTKKTETASQKQEKAKSENKEQAQEVLANGLVLTKNSAMKKKLSSNELEVLQRIVEAEATGEDIYGKILVANVVINRVNDDEFPDTISEVVFQKSGGSYQFSPTKDGRYWSVNITKSTIEAVERALSGEDYSQGALYFFARKLTSEKKAQWFDQSLSRLFRYGCHEFYKDK